MKRNILIGLVTLFLGVLFSFNSNAQLTTSAISGIVVDVNNAPLPAANIVAKHLPTNTIYGISTRVDGRYTLPNLRIGGPYEITISFIGFEDQILEDVFLTLGETSEFNFILQNDVQSLGEVLVISNADVNPGRTGAATSIESERITTIPTISRSASDIYKLSPSSDGNSFAGRNDQYNNFSLDGSIFNNPFGLDAATPGGQANAQPISLDAIDQITVSLAPFDVTQSGFTGASVNAVTKSGTNTYKGTAFAFYRNQDLTGSEVSGSNVFVSDLTQLQTGFSVGGPIIKNKLFFFANFEAERREDLGTNFFAAKEINSEHHVSRVTAADMETVSNLLLAKFGYLTGPYEGYSRKTDSNKGLFKLDWNVNINHSVTATINFLDAYRDLNAHPDAIGRRGPDAITLQFANSGYRINNDILSGIIEVKSILGNKYSNKFQAGYTKFDDNRDPFSEPFPVLNINSNGVRYIVAGHEPFSIKNSLDQKVFQITNNFEMYLGAHTITTGLSFERFEFATSFNLGAYDPFTGYPGGTFGPGFNSVQEFVDYVNAGSMDAAVAAAKATADAGNWALAELNIGQFAIYMQDIWYINENLNVSLGLRFDFPLYFDTKDKIEENIARKGGLLDDGGTYAPDVVYYDEENNPVTFDQTVLPVDAPLFSPRFGFNWDIFGDDKFQLRGGTGLFTGRFPFVWIGNQVANPDFFFYNVTDPDFKFPQIWRTNLGFDKVLTAKLMISSDLIVSKDINAMLVRNYGLRTPTSNLVGADSRPYYLTSASDRATIFGGPTNAYVYTNTDKGYSINWSIEAKKMYDTGVYVTLGYSFLTAQTVSSNTREISSDIFDGNPIVENANRPELSNALYGNRHRLIATANKKWIYGDGDKWSTAVSLFYEAAQGGRFSYTYAGDANGDGSFLNDLIYVPEPRELASYNFSGNAQHQELQRDAFENYIAQDNYLKNRRGDYAERYAILSPWFTRFDMRVLQDLNLMGNQSIQFSMDILNFGNLLNSSWGVREGVTNTQPISVAVNPATQVPTYTFDVSQTSSFVDDFSLNSRWQIQFGIRYNF